MLEPGVTIDDAWVIERPLGRGGMATVYLCRNSHAPRIRVAVKVLGAAGSEVLARRRFVREAEVLCRLNHPGIVRVRDIRMQAEPPYLVMDLVEGESLADVIDRGPVPPKRLATWLAGIARAVAYAHGEGVCHRDIKPANVLVSDGVATLVDWGIALESGGSRLTHSGALAPATVIYAPPEWVEEDDPDPERWDVYSLGVVLAEALTGEQQFKSDESEPSPHRRLLRLAMSKRGHPPLDPGPEHSDALRELVRRMTVAEPARRTVTMAEVHAVLSAEGGVASGEAAPVAEGVPAATVTTEASAAPTALWLGVGLVLLAGLLALAAWGL